jgi:hypothetical protein
LIRPSAKPSLFNLSVEEENLATVPFAILERRVGKHIGKIEINGNKILPDGTEVRVTWQVQGNNELGLPTEQDLDVFVALGVLTFQNNFAKTVSFTGRQVAKILNISGVHGKFYQRLKLAMDRFIPLRFRAITSTDTQEEVKWLNVFQEASFALDRSTGRCTGTVTWTDKLIQSMDSGFFRLLDASRHMELDGLTAKHLYRFLAVAFEKTDLVIIDARKLAMEHLGILHPPKYFSRLLQTLEPAFDQLVRIEVLDSYHVVAAENWRIALHRHAGYVPERKTLLLHGPEISPEHSRAHCMKLLEGAGFPSKVAASYSNAATTPLDFHVLERAGQILLAMKTEEVLPHVAISFIRRALDEGFESRDWDLLDWCEIAVEVCRQKKRAGQILKNSGGLLIKIIKDPEARARLAGQELAASAKQRFRQREEAVLRQREEAEERTLILEYKEFCRRLAETVFQEMPENSRQAMRKEKGDILRQQERFERIPAETREREIDELALQELAKKEAPPYEKWRLRKKAHQAILPFSEGAERVSDIG